MLSTRSNCLNNQALESRFAPHERARLLKATGIGPGVIQRLEEAGIHSFAQIQKLGVQGTVLQVYQRLGTQALANRQRALSKALAEVGMPGDS